MLSWEEYFNRIVSVQLQFDLAKKALVSFKSTPEAIEKYLEGELEEVRNLILKGKEDQAGQLKKHWAFTPDGTKRYFEVLKKNIPDWVAKVENRINQNKFIMSVTLFEGFMKDIHREILKQRPTLLKLGRQVPLGKVINSDKEDIVNEEIEIEIQSLDRKSVEERAKYFRKRLGIDWLDGTIVPLLRRVLELRNHILHVNPDEEIKKLDIVLAHMVCIVIPLVTIAQAAILYPGGFTMVQGLDEEQARSFIKT